MGEGMEMGVLGRYWADKWPGLPFGSQALCRALGCAEASVIVAGSG